MKRDGRVMGREAKSGEDYMLYIRSLFAYESARRLIDKEAAVLEVGFGEGYGAAYMAEYFAKVVGVEVDGEAVEHARKTYQAENLEFIHYDGGVIPYEDGTFDAAVSFQVIEHIYDEMHYLSEIRRVVKPGGIFLCSTPNRIHRLKPGQKPWNRHHVREYSAESLQAVLAKCFTEVAVWGVCGTEAIQEFELKRARLGAKINRIDPLSLRYCIPGRLRQGVANLIRGTRWVGRAREQAEEPAARHSIDDFHIEKEQPEKGIDLMGFCRV